MAEPGPVGITVTLMFCNNHVEPPCSSLKILLMCRYFLDIRLLSTRKFQFPEKNVSVVII